MSSDNYIFEDLFDELSPEDINKNNRDKVIKDGSNDTKTGSHSCWLHASHFRTLKSVTTRCKLDPKDEYRLEVLQQKGKYIDNIDFCGLCSDGKHPVNFLDPDKRTWGAFNGGKGVLYFKLDDLYITFDYDERKQSDIDYMLNVLEEACMILNKFIQIIEPMKLKRTYLSFNSDSENCFDNGDYVSQDIVKQLYLYRTFDDKYMSHVVASLKTLGAKFESEKQITDVLNERTVGSHYKHLIKCGARPSVARLLKVDTILNDNSLEIYIPEGVSLSLGDFSIGSLIKETDNESVSLVVLGTLKVNSLDELNNLKYISRRMKNHHIEINTIITQNMMQYLVENFWFDEIDLSHAQIYKDRTILIDMQNALNHDVKIDCNTELVKFE